MAHIVPSSIVMNIILSGDCFVHIDTTFAFMRSWLYAVASALIVYELLLYISLTMFPLSMYRNELPSFAGCTNRLPPEEYSSTEDSEGTNDPEIVCTEDDVPMIMFPSADDMNSISESLPEFISMLQTAHESSATNITSVFVSYSASGSDVSYSVIGHFTGRPFDMSYTVPSDFFHIQSLACQ